MADFRYTLKPEGPLSARVAVVCEKPARDEVAAGRLLVGPSGSRVRRHLRKAGLDAGDRNALSREVWLTNAVQSFNDPTANPSKQDIIREQPRLYKELCSLPNLNIVIAMGGVAIQSLGNFEYDLIDKKGKHTTGITARRGSRLTTPYGSKFIPTFHPAYYMRGEWRYAPVVQFDINRAVEESSWPEIRKKNHRLWYIRPQNLTQALTWLERLKLSASTSTFMSFDIETRQGAHDTWYISCIAFSSDPTEAYCIPLTRRGQIPYWPNISDECSIWRAIAEVLNLPNVKYVTQNGAAFDAWQLRRHGIVLEHMNNGFDTFSAHSLLAPDLPHDLGFLVSIYTDEEYYKDESGRSEYLGKEAGEDMYWTYNAKDAALTLECAYGIMADLREI